MRKIKYSNAINEALHQVMERDQSVIQIGVGINTPWYVGQTMNGLLENYKEERMIDTPVSENGTMGVAVGAAITGLRPIITFSRMDFMHYAMDQICNHAAILNYTLGGNLPVPLTIRAIINRGGEQASQHSQALQAIFMHVPGLKVVMPSNAYDAKGMLTSAVEEDNPVIFIDDKWLYDEEGEVPTEFYKTPLEGAKVLSPGSDVTVAATSYMVKESCEAVRNLSENNISVELIDLRVIKPLDVVTIAESVRKTGKLVVVDGGWKTGGITAEMAASISDQCFSQLQKPIVRIALPDLPAPASKVLENAYYPNSDLISKSILELCQ